jgi:cobalamin-dependent methionine synthase I
VHAILPVEEVAFEGPLIARALAGATQVALAVCTIGPALEERVRALFAAGDPLRAMALDGAGVAALGQVSEAVGERICEEAAAQGLRTGMRVSPGQEGWPLEQQRVLFSLLPAERIGVRLNESCLMIPQKSVSFVVGLGPEMRADAVACDFCSRREHCRWRAR